MKGIVVEVCVADRKGVQKNPVPVIELMEEQGVRGDAHAGPGHRQVSLLADESAEQMRQKGVDVGPGAFGENILTSGLVLTALPVGTRLRLGAAALGEVTQIGKECHTRCAIFYAAGVCVMPTEGIFCRVLKGGPLRKGDTIEVLEAAPSDSRPRAAVIVASDTRSSGVNVDLAGPAAAEALQALGLSVTEVLVVPDDREALAAALRRLCDEQRVDLVITSGGTGLAPRDITPEATRDVLEREAPGLAELVRTKSLAVTPLASLSRGIAGTRGRTLIVNLPGSPKAVREGVSFLAAVLPHALETLRGQASECATTGVL